MKIYTDIQQNTPEWINLRLGKFTASKAQAIGNKGAGLETLAFEKVAEVLTGVSAEKEYSNVNMENGNDREDEAVAAYELETGIALTTVGFVEKDEHTGCSPDRLINTEGVVEVKCPSDPVFAKYLFFRKIDPAYEWQIAMQLLITERKFADFVVYNPNFKEKALQIVRVERDEEKIEKLRIGLEWGVQRKLEILSKV